MIKWELSMASATAWSATTSRRERRGASLQVPQHPRHAHLQPGPRRPRRAPRQRHRPRPRRRRRRRGPAPRRRPLLRGLLGPDQRPGLLPGRLHPVRRRRQRGRPVRRQARPLPGPTERQRRPLRRRPRQRRQGHHIGAVRRGHQLLPALQRRVRGPVHDRRGLLPGEHRRAAARQRVAVLRIQGQPARHQPQLRHVPAGHHGQGRRQRAGIHQPLRRHGGRRLRRAREGRRARRQVGRVGERLAVGRRVRGHRGERQEVQPGADQQLEGRNAEAARADRDVRVRHVQREQQAR